MSPHAFRDTIAGSQHDSLPLRTQHDPYRTRQESEESIPTLTGTYPSQFDRFNDDDVHDLVCVGFGPASLAIAVALHDELESGGSRLSTRTPKIRFLERQERFAWHAGMLIPGAKMQISFVKDMATLRNPRSEFTFLNYLHQKDRLVAFTNLSTFLPQRIEYEDYMRWCADHFASLVDYGHEVQSVKVGSRNAKTGEIDSFEIISENLLTGRTSSIRAKHVLIAAGGRPKIPDCLPRGHIQIIHSSQYGLEVARLRKAGRQPRNVAIIGGGQSAAEVFNDIPNRFPGAQSTLLLRGAALKPSDDSPFVNEIFNPERVDHIYSQEPQLRADTIINARSTNYGVVRLELLEHIYSQMYSYRIRQTPETQWPLRILNHREVLGATETKLNDRPAVRLEIRNNSSKYHQNGDLSDDAITADLVVVASGYTRNTHEAMLSDLQEYSINDTHDDKLWAVQRDYRVKFRPGTVQPDTGIWLQGCNESTHGLADSLLSILAVRAGEIVQSIFGRGDK